MRLRRIAKRFGGARLGARVGRVLVALALVATTLVVAGGGAPTLAIQPYNVFFHADTNGAVIQVGNNLMSCTTGTTGCALARAGSGASLNNNNWNMSFVNADPSVAGNSAFFSSSAAALTLPAGASVLYAQLSWGARTQNGTGGADAPSGPVGQMRLRVAGSASYQTITASNVYGNTPSISDGMYHTFADVTSLVQAAGSGTYWGANVRAATGADRYAGWSLVVVTSDPAQPLRDLTVFNGFAIVDSPAGQSIRLSGFLAPEFGTVNASVGVVSYEGDLGVTGDQMRLDSVPLSDAAVPLNNFFNSGNSALGVANSTRTPADVNMFGFDVKTVAADGVLDNGATSATVNLTTSLDTYAPGVVTTSINLFSPVFPPSSKSVTDVTPSTTTGAGVGDTLEYTIDLPNTGGDGAANAVITDALPPGVTYVPGSIQYATGTAAANSPLGVFTSRTDATGDDNAEFLAGTPPGGNGTVRVRAGVGANAVTGGTIRPNDRVVVKFRVTVNASAAGTTISNTDQLNYTLATLGTPITRTGLPATIAVAPRADLSITKTGTPSPLAPGQNATYTLTVKNNGPSSATSVVVTDALPASLTFVSATPSVGGPCTFTAPQVRCPLGTMTSGQTVTVTVVAHLAANATSISSVNDVASVTSATDDPVASNNVSSITTPIRPTADMKAAIAVTAGSPATPGGPVTLTLTASNLGPSDAANATLTADLAPLTNVRVLRPAAGRLHARRHGIDVHKSDARGGRVVPHRVDGDGRAGPDRNQHHVVGSRHDLDVRSEQRQRHCVDGAAPHGTIGRHRRGEDRVVGNRDRGPGLLVHAHDHQQRAIERAGRHPHGSAAGRVHPRRHRQLERDLPGRPAGDLFVRDLPAGWDGHHHTDGEHPGRRANGRVHQHRDGFDDHHRSQPREQRRERDRHGGRQRRRRDHENRDTRPGRTRRADDVHVEHDEQRALAGSSSCGHRRAAVAPRVQQRDEHQRHVHGAARGHGRRHDHVLGR